VGKREREKKKVSIWGESVLAWDAKVASEKSYSLLKIDAQVFGRAFYW
jgi:hypothetical protein